MNPVAKLRCQLSNKSILNEKLINLFICFLIYSFTGWVAETIYMSVYHGHLVKRGFLIGPFCAVYGLGSIIVVYILNHIKSHPLILFLSAALLTSVVELAAGILLSRLTTKRLWDYTGNFGSFMGYICLRNTIIWGVMSLALVYIIHPSIMRFIAGIPLKTKEVFCCSAVAWLSLDIIITVYSSLHGVNNIVWLSQVFSRGISFHRVP